MANKAEGLPAATPIHERYIVCAHGLYVAVEILKKKMSEEVNNKHYCRQICRIRKELVANSIYKQKYVDKQVQTGVTVGILIGFGLKIGIDWILKD